MQTNRDWLVADDFFLATNNNTQYSVISSNQSRPQQPPVALFDLMGVHNYMVFVFHRNVCLCWYTWRQHDGLFLYSIIQGEIFGNNRVGSSSSGVVRFGFAFFIRSSLGLLYAIEKSCGILIGAKMVVGVLSTPREIITCFSVLGPVDFVSRWSFAALRTTKNTFIVM